MCGHIWKYVRAGASSVVITLASYGAHASAPAPVAPGPPLTSSFSGPCWSIVAPVGGTASSSNAHLFLNVPGGSNHDSLIPGNEAVRVLQPIGNVNFDVSIKIDSPVVATDAGTNRGLMMLAASNSFITFELATDGTNIHLSAETVAGGKATKVLDDLESGQYQNPFYLRLTRTGSAYVAFYSIDGVSWTQAASFTYAQTPTWIGPFASNYSSVPASTVPVVMSVGWFNVSVP
jgi:hypothetical protein